MAQWLRRMGTIRINAYICKGATAVPPKRKTVIHLNRTYYDKKAKTHRTIQRDADLA